jgi:hypothetical protein
MQSASNAPTTTRPPAPTEVSASWHTGADTDSWLTGRRNHGATPAEIATDLVANGWSADLAARWALRSLRSSDRQPVLWFALCWSAGLAAVGLTTAAHQLLAPYPDRNLAAVALTLSVVMAPIAFVCGVLARRSEQASTFAVWSPERRFWFGTLAVCTAVVGLVRLITYVYAVIATVVAATPEPLYGRDLAQVAVSLTVAVPLFWWSFTEWRRSNVVLSGLAGDTAAEHGDEGVR